MSKCTEKDIDALTKITWDGGIIDALSCGIQTIDFESKELKEAWWQLESHWRSIQKYVDVIEQAMEVEGIGGYYAQ